MWRSPRGDTGQCQRRREAEGVSRRRDSCPPVRVGTRGRAAGRAQGRTVWSTPADAGRRGVPRRSAPGSGAVQERRAPVPAGGRPVKGAGGEWTLDDRACPSRPRRRARVSRLWKFPGSERPWALGAVNGQDATVQTTGGVIAAPVPTRAPDSAGRTSEPSRRGPAPTWPGGRGLRPWASGSHPGSRGCSRVCWAPGRGVPV